MTAFRSLEALAKPRPRRAGEACELCTAVLGGDHRHVVELDRRRIRCACHACAMLFLPRFDTTARYRTVPDRVVFDVQCRFSELQWAALEIPVRLAFFFYSSRAKKWIASYPSPAGATESLLPLDAWAAIAESEALVRAIEPDVEALLAYGERLRPIECLLVPIDTCYELVGRVRLHWQGIDGGSAVREEIGRHLARLRARSRALRAAEGPTR